VSRTGSYSSYEASTWICSTHVLSILLYSEVAMCSTLSYQAGSVIVAADLPINCAIASIPPISGVSVSKTISYRAGPGILVEEPPMKYRSREFYPVRVGDVYGEHYRVVRKLGWGSFSTTWLTEDLRLFPMSDVYSNIQNGQGGRFEGTSS